MKMHELLVVMIFFIITEYNFKSIEGWNVNYRTLYSKGIILQQSFETFKRFSSFCFFLNRKLFQVSFFLFEFSFTSIRRFSRLLEERFPVLWRFTASQGVYF